MSASVSELEERIEELEFERDTNIFNFGGYYWARYDNITWEDADWDVTNNPKADDHKHEVTVLAQRLQLNANANISNNLKFYSALGMNLWNNVFTYRDSEEETSASAGAGNYDPADSLGWNFGKESEARFERAYFNYTLESLPRAYFFCR